ncbi:uncharacterized protein A1O9_11386 [Exophiala aquamarina CBS 119918]|uniref:Lysophospholipase n=1 Tax=Exophiala aquamarina CBS 119918 TaxID=1182545 RepID=A0A072NXE1_9EURO|nr:uncharacterized protein A1O9_11386 [Exophiala aquamarina CBS 119918]KEF52544.1 hypothetical protein A1O9_11386 [Exophiala aquamarina CBS 119918]
MSINFILILLILQCLRSWSLSAASRQTDPNLCNVSSGWDPTPANYLASQADQNLQSWWENELSSDARRFEHAFGKLLGINQFRCGISSISSCTIPSCFEIQEAENPSWIYLVALSLQNLNQMFNVMYNGITLGQLDATNLVDDLAANIFEWKDPEYHGNTAGFWVAATLTSICTFGAYRVGTAVGSAAFFGLGTFGGAATSHVAESFQPAQDLTKDDGIRSLNDMFYNLSSAARSAIDSWANDTFAGQTDENGSSILDFVKDGAFVDPSVLPSQTQVETYYRSSLVARAVNGLWRTKPLYLISTTANISNTELHQDSRYLSPRTGKTYVPYYFHDKTQLEPPDFAVLNGSFYSIKPSQTTESSARAWEQAGGNNYTSELSTARLLEALTSNERLTPFQDGASWEGMFTLPVCDVGTRVEWLVPYGGKILPCCCGEDCADTKNFIEAANLNKSESWLDACREQLRDTSLRFDSIEYGIETSTGAAAFWKNLGLGRQIGLSIGCACGFIILLFMCWSCR